MATTNQQRAQCVLWYAKFESVKRVQREFRREYGVRNVPKYDSIMLWYRTFAETGSVMKKHAGGRRRNPEHKEAISEVKDLVYAQKPRNIDDLKLKTTQAFTQITPLMLQRTWAELHHRYQLCRVRNGGHVEG
ncbi:hypothetical protein C0J52_08610 [Blattella germanica]|nr:hypothetical protein C0J52_08610 [Blattella germanica]